MPWDSGTWDSGHWDAPVPTPNTKKTNKHKHMINQDYYPKRIGDQIVWLQNFKTKLPTYSTVLGLVAGDVTAVLLDVDNAIYALDDFRGGIATFSSAAYQRIEDALSNDTLPGNIVWLTFAAPAPIPTAVAYGCLRRVFAYINNIIKKAAAYDDAIGSDLGTEPPAIPAPDPGTTAPEFDLRTTSGGKLEVVWTKGVFDGVKLQFDLGGGVIQNDTDLRPNYTLNWMPPAGTAVMVKVRLRYIYKGEDFGQWSEWKTFTLASV